MKQSCFDWINISVPSRCLSVSLLLVLGCIPLGFADDSIIADYGKTVFPQQTDKIKMVSEKVAITFGVDRKGHREAKINCHFVFRNETETEVKTKVGFPGNDSEHGPAWSRPLRDFTVSVDGKSYQNEVKEEILGDATDPHYSYKEWYLWEMSFPPKKDALVDNSYSYSLSSDSGYRKLTLNYELDTGANWSGKIGDALITVTYDNSADLENRIIDIQPAGWARKGNQIIWHLKDIKPSSADNILVEEKNLAAPQPDYRGPLLFPRKQKNIASALQCSAAPDLKQLRFGNLQKMSLEELRLLRNSIYASHGLEFHSEELKKYFSGCSWYKPNKNFSELDLTDDELVWVKRIQEAERTKASMANGTSLTH